MKRYKEDILVLGLGTQKRHNEYEEYIYNMDIEDREVSVRGLHKYESLNLNNKKTCARSQCVTIRVKSWILALQFTPLHSYQVEELMKTNIYCTMLVQRKWDFISMICLRNKRITVNIQYFFSMS
uniref:Uncharacterized protein n=1 Tax=Cacopsylla melanoneura TaxID=428564 RepID=A0A8D9BH24_9HEMI